MSEMFDTPESGPQSQGVNNPVKFAIDYKSGRTPERYANVATPEQSDAGFSYYNRDEKARIALPNMTFFILGNYWQMGGEVGEGSDRRRFTSNPVSDMRIQPFFLREKFVSGGGLSRVGYKDELKDWAFDNRIEKAAGLGITLFCYVPECSGIVEIQCNRRIEDAMAKAIERTTGKKAGRLFQMNFDQISTEYWAFQFNGEFVAVNKEGKKYDGGELFWEPVFKCGIVKAGSEKTQQRFNQINPMRDELTAWVDYVNAKVMDRYNSANHEAQAAPVTRQASPTAPATQTNPQNIPSYNEVFPSEAPPPPADGDDYGDLPF